MMTNLRSPLCYGVIKRGWIHYRGAYQEDILKTKLTRLKNDKKSNKPEKITKTTKNWKKCMKVTKLYKLK